MAYVANTANATDDEDKKRAINISDGAGATGGSDGMGARAGMPGDGSSTPTTPVVFKDYLDANQEGSASLGDTVKTGIGQTVDKANTAITTGQNTFNTAADAGKVVWNQAALDNTLATGQANDDFNKLLAGTYTGPKTWAPDDIAAATAATQKAQQTGQLADSQSGRKQLLQEYIDRSLANQTGNLNLNSGLLSGRQDVVDGVTAAGAAAKPLPTNLTAAQTAATAKANEIAAGNVAVRDQALGGVKGYLSQQDTANATALAQAQAQQAQAQQAARDSLAQGQIPNNWDTLGIAPMQRDALMNQIRMAQDLGLPVDLSKFFSASGQITSNLSAADAARLNALAKIAGTNATYTAGGDASTGQLDAQGALAQLQSQVTAKQAENKARDDAAAAEAARLAQYNTPTGNLWADAANQAYLRGDISSYNYYMLLAKQLDKYTQTNARIAAAGPGMGYTDTGMGSMGGPGASGTGAGNGSTSTGGGPGTGGAPSGISGGLSAAGVPGMSGINAVADAVSAANTSPNGGGSAATGGTSVGSVGSNADGGTNGNNGTSSTTGSGNDAVGGIGGNGTGNSSTANGGGATGIGGTAGSGNTGGDNGANDGNGDAAGGGSGGGGGGRIICTAMAKRYGLDDTNIRIWTVYRRKYLTQDTENGYHKVFLPLVKYGFESGDGITHRAVRKTLEWLAVTRTTDVVAEMNGTKRVWWHKLLRQIIEPSLTFVGKMMAKRNKK